MARTEIPAGVRLWSGPSRINGEPVLVVATGIARPSDNDKTGPMVQVSYIPTEAVYDAVYDGRDEAVCGTCPLRYTPETGVRSCYVMDRMLVTLSKYGPGYPEADADALSEWLPRGRSSVRLGAYGDPAAVPPDVNLGLLAQVQGHTGYTRRWRELEAHAPESKFLMASVFTLAEAAEAQSRGWRTYRVTLPDEGPASNEIVCPHHADPRVQCIDCGLCGGTDGPGSKSITNPVHGSIPKIAGFVSLRSLLDAE